MTIAPATIAPATIAPATISPVSDYRPAGPPPDYATSPPPLTSVIMGLEVLMILAAAGLYRKVARLLR